MKTPPPARAAHPRRPALRTGPALAIQTTTLLFHVRNDTHIQNASRQPSASAEASMSEPEDCIRARAEWWARFHNYHSYMPVEVIHAFTAGYEAGRKAEREHAGDSHDR